MGSHEDFLNMNCSFLAVAVQSQIQIKFKTISSENAHNKGLYQLYVCFPIGQACGHERLSLMYEKIVLYHVGSQLTGSI